MSEVSILIWLIITHMVGDFYLQPTRWVTSRYSQHLRSPALYMHASVHGLLSFSVLLLFSELSLTTCLLVALFIGTTHLITDAIKSFLPSTLLWFVLDQIAHLVFILIAWFWASDFDIKKCLAMLNSLLTYKVLIIALAYGLCAKPISVFIGILLTAFIPKTQAGTSEHSLASAGKTIGYIERWLVLTFVLLGQFSGVGFLLAAKSVFRFGDLSKSADMKLTEYVMLGTLTSIGSAVAIGLFVQYVINLSSG